MSDILLNKDTGDILLVGGELVLTSTIQEAASQRLTIKLNTYLGEWFADVEQGIPYFQSILRKGVDKATVDAIFQSVILEDEDIKGITSFQSTIVNNQYQLTFTALSNSGEVISYINTFGG